MLYVFAMTALPKWNTPQSRLQGVCDVLNVEKDKERGQEFVELLREWMNASSLAAMLREHPDLEQDLRLSVQPFFEPSKKRKFGVYRVTSELPDESPRSFAMWMFAQLVTNLECEKLAGPCARCGNYYIKKRASQKVYCQRKCGNAATAIARTRKRIQDERKDKLLRAKAAIREWRSAKPKEDWKKWVVERAKLDPRFLTRNFSPEGREKPKKGK